MSGKKTLLAMMGLFMIMSAGLSAGPNERTETPPGLPITAYGYASSAVAGWQPGDGHKMHYPQLPDEAGWDVNATRPAVLADDWMCGETGWIKDIHFWGSWRNGIEGDILFFTVRIYDDILNPDPSDPASFSRPGQIIWEREITIFEVTPIIPETPEGWYDPPTGEMLGEDHQAYVQYDVYLDEPDWFWQDAGTVYWLCISAVIVDPESTQWGWKSTVDHWNDDAVWGIWNEFAWMHMFEPPGAYDYIPGDVDGDGDVDYDDTEYYTLWQMGMGDPPPFLVNGYFYAAVDANGDCAVNIGDMTYLGAYLGNEGPAPTFCPEYPPLIYAQSLDLAFVVGGEAPAEFVACCLEDGSCLSMPSDDCVLMGGVARELGSTCGPVEACCLADGTCLNLDPECCRGIGGAPLGPGTLCAGDNNGNEIDDICESDSCLAQYPGDVNNDGQILVDDLTYFAQFMYLDGPPPPVMANADADGNCCIDMDDFDYIQAFIYEGGPPPVECTCVNPLVCNCNPGDPNHDGVINVGDAVYMINYVFKQGLAPIPYAYCAGDANCDCEPNVGDAVYIVNYVFKSGAKPCSCCEWKDRCGWPPIE